MATKPAKTPPRPPKEILPEPLKLTIPNPQDMPEAAPSAELLELGGESFEITEDLDLAAADPSQDPPDTLPRVDKFVQVKFKHTLAGEIESFYRGEIYALLEPRAARMVEAGHCVYVERAGERIETHMKPGALETR